MNTAGPAIKTWAASPGQKRLWFLGVLDNAAVAAYNMPVALRFDGVLAVDALASAFAGVMARHEVLRTTLVEVDGEPRQVVHPQPLTALQLVDVSSTPDPETAAGEIAAEHATTAFDLETGPLLRATVLRLGDDRHVLLFNVHHIVCDEWSLAVLVSELSALYAKARRNEACVLDPSDLPLQYKDYAAWQNRLLEGDEMERHRQYWDQKLTSAPATVNFPTDRARPPIKSYDASALTVDLPAEVVAELRRRAAAGRTTLFATLVALVKVLLFRYTGQTDITVGCPVAGREHPDLSNQIGFYVNTLALRDHLRASESFDDVLDHVKATLVEALEHQGYPFDDLVSRVSRERDPSRSPVFDVSINLTPSSGETPGIDLPGVTVSAFDTGYARAKVDLGFDFTETPQALRLTLIYSSALYDERRISRLARHFAQLAAAVVAHPDRPISSLPLLSEAERQELISFSGAAERQPIDRTVVDLFEEQVRRRPEHPALQCGAAVVSYGELHRGSNRLARVLRANGVDRDVPIGVLMERGPSMVMAFLAILKASGVYLPLDPAVPQARITAMVNDSLTPIIVTDRASEDKLPSFIGTPLNVDTESEEIENESPESLTTKPEPEDLAYLIYTSGSTGVPKAVALEHRGLSNVAVVQQHMFALVPDDRVLQFSSAGFDASVFEFVMALCSGAMLTLASRDSLMPGESLPRFLRDAGITIVTVPPSALAVTPPTKLPHLRLINVAGEACSPDLPIAWGRHRRFLNLYGPSEATIWSTLASPSDGQLPPSIGRPIANTAIHVLSHTLEPVPVGAPGEICIGGVGVARGYLHRASLTAERFVPDPFGADPGARLFRTGDLGRWLEDGTIAFIGRADTQVKIRGYRVELGEIEAVLARHPRVGAAAVVYRPDHTGARQLRGYIVSTGGDVDVQEVRSWLRASLPEYMLPITITALPAFPTTASGKIDRSALPDPDATIREVADFVAPRTALESVLARMFAEVLGRESISVTANFFDSGGHSLLATRVVSRVREWFHIEFPLPRLFQESSVRQLADALRVIEPEKTDKIAGALDRLWSMSPEQRQELRASRGGFPHQAGVD